MLGSQGISLSPSISTPLATKSGSKVQSPADAKLKDTAKEFEATFLSMILKEMRETLEPDGGLFPGDSGDVQGGLFDLYLGRHLADAGGVGLASYLARQQQATTPTAKPTPTDAPDPTRPARRDPA